MTYHTKPVANQQNYVTSHCSWIFEIFQLVHQQLLQVENSSTFKLLKCKILLSNCTFNSSFVIWDTAKEILVPKTFQGQAKGPQM